MQARLREAQIEAGKLWTDIVKLHAEARAGKTKWPTRDTLQKATKGKYALHSQTIQMLCHQLLANVEATAERRRSEPKSRSWLKYPYREKTFFPLYWPAQAVSYDAKAKRLILPMGRGHKSLTFKLDLEFAPGGVKLIWNEGYELHLVRSDIEQAKEPPGNHRACIDLGEIHLAAVVDDDGHALIVTGRGLRSDKRLQAKQLGEIAALRSRCTKRSRRWKHLQHARQKRSLLTQRRLRDKRHKATRKVINFCIEQKIGSLFIGDPRGVRSKKCGRHHNQRISLWEVGKDIDYLGHKAKKAKIACFTGDERGTSSRCPQCGHRHKPKGRVWQCKKCGFQGHRDLVGAANIHPIAFGAKVAFPAQATYLRPAPQRAARGIKNRAPAQVAERSSSPDTGLWKAIPPLSPQLLMTSPPPGATSSLGRTAGSPARRKTLFPAA